VRWDSRKICWLSRKSVHDLMDTRPFSPRNWGIIDRFSAYIVPFFSWNIYGMAIGPPYAL
jgi:hypothetical protein